MLELTIDGFDNGPEAEKNTIKIGFQFQNYGEDLAFLREHGLTYHDTLKGEVPEPPGFGYQTKMYWPIATQQSWGSSIGPGCGTIVLTEEQRRAAFFVPLYPGKSRHIPAGAWNVDT